MSGQLWGRGQLRKHRMSHMFGSSLKEVPTHRRGFGPLDKFGGDSGGKLTKTSRFTDVWAENSL